MTSLWHSEPGSKTVSFDDLLAWSTTALGLTDQDVARLRHAFYQEGRFDRPRAAGLFHANRVMQGRGDAWSEFYLEALEQFFLNREEGGYRFSTRSETTLLGWLGDDLSNLNSAERRLLARILLQADEVSAEFKQVVFNSFRMHLPHKSKRLLGGHFKKSLPVDRLDVQVIRALIFRRSDYRSVKVSRLEVDFLFHLDGQFPELAERDDWSALLTETAALYLSACTETGPGLEPSICSKRSNSIKAALYTCRRGVEAARLYDKILEMTTQQLLH